MTNTINAFENMGFNAVDANELDLVEGGWSFRLRIQVGGFRLSISARG